MGTRSPIARSPGRRQPAGAHPELCIIGGAGHVGLPLAIVFASRGLRVLVYDIDRAKLDLIGQGRMPFMEQGAEALLKQVMAQGRLSLTHEAADAACATTWIVTIGTPIDEFLNPDLRELERAMAPLMPVLSDDHVVVLRSTIYPGTTEWLDRYLRRQGKTPKVAFCPERVVEGRAIEELQTLPQIVSGTTPEAEARAAALFSRIAPEVVRLKPMEAEFGKLFCNAYRYIQFATANQFYMIATSAGLDYYRILQGMQHHYPRLKDVPRAGFAAGPCLFKDTMQLSAFYDNEFSLGYTAMLVNEGLPLYLIQRLAAHGDLSTCTVGLLGMAFKADSDDPRASLSYKLKKGLRFRVKRVLTTDPYVKDPDLLPVEDVIAQSDLLILCVPHRAYQDLDLHGKPVVDMWNLFGRGGTIGPVTARQPRRRTARRPAAPAGTARRA